MPGPVSQSYDGPQDHVPILPRWAFPHLSDEEYRTMIPDHSDRPTGITRQAWDIARRLYQSRSEMSESEAQDGLAFHDQEAGQHAWMRVAARILSECQRCNGSGTIGLNGQTVPPSPILCPECRGSGSIF